MDKAEVSDDRSIFGTMEEREAILGFRPQREIPYNAILPYADRLDAESNDQLAHIKANFARMVQLRDIKIGGSHWIGQLSKYIRLFGLKFSKADHLTFIHLSFELLTIPDLDFSLVYKFSQLLITLLKKRMLISRDELVLPWRPLYKLLDAVICSPYEHHGLVLFPANIETVLKNLVHVCRVYFPIEATQEMLDEWKPFLCPFDDKMLKGTSFMEHFLPTILYPEEHSAGFRLWFDELIGFWDSCQNNPAWEANIVNLFSRLANDCIGYIDWEPYLAKMFTRFLRSFNLPVGSKKVIVTTNTNNYEVQPMTKWIVATFSNGSTVQLYLNKLFKSLESFYHPSNYGRWNTKLMKFLSRLPLTFVKRVQRERMKRKSWEPDVSIDGKLSDDDISRFVESMKPVVFIAMFSKTGCADSASAFQNLATLRPELIIPPLLEKTYPALEILTEPHRLTACLQCTVSVLRSMLSNQRWYPEGRSHVIPLLSLSLPGIDPNDIKKSLMTFQLISTLASLVPIVDCSEAALCRNDLSEDELELCSATAQFEDVVLQYFDRVFGLIENSVHQHTRADSASSDKMSQEEAMLDICLLSSANSILQQCSLQIYKEAISRLFRFATDSVFEIKVAGKFTADLVRAAVKVCPEVAVKMFVPGLCEKIINRAKGEDLTQEEHLDNEFLWNLLLLSQVVRCNGRCLVPYENELTKVLKITLHLKCKDALEFSGNMLKFIFKALTSIYALEFRSTTIDWDASLTQVLPIREWGTSGDLYNLHLKWHCPSANEKALTERLLKTFLIPELTRTANHCNGTTVLSREDLLQCISIINNCLIGAGSALPHWTADEPITFVESLVDLQRFSNRASCGNDDININGENVRILVAKHIRPLLDHMLLTSEDDTKTLVEIIKTLRFVMFFFGTLKDDFDGRWKSRHHIKHFMEHKLLGKKRHIRPLLVDRTTLQHELRTIYLAPKSFTVLHGQLFRDLHRLAVSRYMQVRKNAQSVLGIGFHMFAYSYRMIIDDTVKYLKDDSSIEHHQLKGALYMILGDKKRSLMTKRSFETMNRLWPALVATKHCEKPSVVRLYDDIIDKLHKNIESTEIGIIVPQSAVDVANEMWMNNSQPKPSLPCVNDDETEKGKLFEINRNNESISGYNNLVHSLVNLAESGTLGWKFHQVSLELLVLLIRYDIRFPSAAVRLLVANMNHTSLNVRKICVAGVSAILKLQKRKHKQIEIDPLNDDNILSNQDDIHCHGDRQDNDWIHYKKNKVPKNEDEWNKFRFVEKTHWGYYKWPLKMMIYAPPVDQPSLGRLIDQLPDDERPIFEAFTNSQFVDTFVNFMSLEENKEKDRFQAKHFLFFKGLFRNFDDTILPLLKPHVERLVSDTSHDKHETNQRCSAEIIAGLVRGSKHWTYEKSKLMWDWLIPVIKTVLSNFSVESIADWGTCLATAAENRDPHKISRLLELLMENPLNGDGGSFGDSSRIYLLQGVLSQQEWRVPELLHRLYDYIMSHLCHPYKNVRDRLGSAIVNLFLYDIRLPNATTTLSPRRATFMQHVLPLLEPLKDEFGGNGVKNGGGSGGLEILMTPDTEFVLKDALLPNVANLEIDNCASTVGASNGEDAERKRAINLCKTVLKSLQGIYTRMFQSGSPEILKLLPIICRLESETKDPELTTECVITLICISQSLLTPQLIEPTLEAIKEVSTMSSWHARVAGLSYLQRTIFCNLFVLQNDSIVSYIRRVVFDLICDEQLEVRELAGVTLGGFLHCGYLKIDSDMINHFEQLSKTKIKKRNREEVIAPEQIIKRHAGVIGLSACVLAFPYDVPDIMPQLLMNLSSHLNDPPPIQTTVKKALTSFKRTHLDSWHDHKQKFTDDQLVVLTELLVSPNYYA